VDRLVRWAAPFEEGTWAIESAGGLGQLLAQQLVDAGEHVVDVPPTLASRVRLLDTRKARRNDPNDARSVAIAAMRSPDWRRIWAANSTGLRAAHRRCGHGVEDVADGWCSVWGR
jgi:transposase